MANPFRRIRLVYRRSPALLKVIILGLLIAGTVTLLTLRGAYLDTQAQENKLRQEAATLEQQNQSLSQDIQELGSVQSIKDLANRLLGLFDPDSVIFKPE